MTKNIKIVDYDIIYLSYDEPNAEKNYADLCQKIPWAKRVHGVKGSDSAHKACAQLSETERFVTVDGDNIVSENFINEEIDLSNYEDTQNVVISWAASNYTNGLVYGNGGLKLWPKNYVLGMKTHENADPKNKQNQVDFCWDLQYIQVEKCFSRIYNNATAKQAWRAGFREGVKMCLDRGLKPDNLDEFFKNDWRNLQRLYIWMTVGSDVEHGLWAIYGARHGLTKTLFSNWDFVNVRDFDYLNELWDTDVMSMTEEEVYNETVLLGKKIKDELDLPIPTKPLDPEASKFFKTTYETPARLQNFLLEINRGDI